MTCGTTGPYNVANGIDAINRKVHDINASGPGCGDAGHSVSNNSVDDLK